MEQFSQLVIDEKDNYYVLQMIDNGKKIQVGRYLMDEVGLDRLYNFLTIHLRKFKINGMNKVVLFNNGGMFCAEVLGDNSSKKIVFKINNRVFKKLGPLVLERYMTNRDEVAKNNDLNNVRIESVQGVSKFEYKAGVLNLFLAADHNMNILVSEREFFREFIETRCENKKIEVNYMIDKKGFDKTWIVTCGMFRMLIPAGYTYSTIMGIIREHNDNINENRKRR